MELVGAGFHRDVEHAAAHLTILGGIIAGLNRDFLNRIHAGLILRGNRRGTGIGCLLALDPERLRVVGGAVNADLLIRPDTPRPESAAASPFGLRMPALPAWPAPIPNTGSSFRLLAVTL